MFPEGVTTQLPGETRLAFLLEDRLGGLDREFWSYPQSRTLAELLIDCEEDMVLRAVLIGMLREHDRMLLPMNRLYAGVRIGQ
jgi:hypothetical protein